MLSAFFSRSVILFFGLLYPAYNSYKAIKTKNVKEYVKWMMYWIVFSLFTAVEMITDIFLSWFPFYYEIKILFVLWLLSPWTRGANILYIKVVHPQLSKHENEIDSYITQASDKGYSSLLQFGTKGIDCLVNGFTVGATKALEHINEVKEKSQTQDCVVSAEVMDAAAMDPLTTSTGAPANTGTAPTSDGDSKGPTKKVRRQKSTDKVARKSIKKLANGDEKQDQMKAN